MDDVLPAPPLVDPPLSLVGLAPTLLDNESLTTRRNDAIENAASLQVRLTTIEGERNALLGLDVNEDTADALADLDRSWTETKEALALAEAFAAAEVEEVAKLLRWEHGFLYLPELSNGAALEVWVPDSGSSKSVVANQSDFGWYDPWVAVAHDKRSLLGWPHSDFDERAQRALRALLKHEVWQCEAEFWGGAAIPTNYHLTASPNTPTTSPHRTITAWPNPTPAPGTALNTAVSPIVALAALDQAIADADAGTGMIHATPYLMQIFMSKYPYIRDSDGKVYTVNHNLLVPGYGYTGMGPDAADRVLADVVTTLGSPTVTSATGAFTDADVGRPFVDAGPTGDVESTTYAGSNGAALSTLATLAVASMPRDVPTAGSGTIVTSGGTHTFSYTGVSGNTFTGCVYSGTQTDTVASGAAVTVNASTTLPPTGAIPPGTIIASVTNGTTVVLSVNATESASDVSVTLKGIGGRRTGAAKQWAYATEMVYKCRGDEHVKPANLEQMSPLITQDTADVRAERSWAFPTNRLARYAVLVDTTL